MLAPLLAPAVYGLILIARPLEGLPMKPALALAIALAPALALACPVCARDRSPHLALLSAG